MTQKILLIDDSSLFLELERNILEREGYITLSATNGKQGLDIARREHPDLILLDINMPIMNGFEFLIFARNDDRLKKIPVVVVTTKGRDTDVKYALKLGADDYITKPVEDRTLQEKVRLFLDRDRKRLGPRKSLDLPVEVNDFEQTFGGFILDLSRGGILIGCDRELSINKKVELSFQLPFESNMRSVNSFGSVISCVASEGNSEIAFELRIQFINLRRENQSFIDDLINRDVKSIASFLISSPVQRRASSIEQEQKIPSARDLLSHELNGLLDDYYRVDDIARQLFEKYEKLKNHLKQSQLEFHDLDLRYAQFADDYQILANLFVATYRLLAGESCASVLGMILDILENLVGAEHFDLILLTSDGVTFESFSPRTSEGNLSQHQRVKECLSSGEIFLAEDEENDDEHEPFAVIPMKIGGSVMGCILIMSVLPQNRPLTVLSRKLIELLHQHAGFALVKPLLIESCKTPAGINPELTDRLLKACKDRDLPS